MILRTPREIVLMMARDLDPQESAPEDYEYIHEWVPEHSCCGAGDPTCAACWMHDFDRCLTAHDAEVRDRMAEHAAERTNELSTRLAAATRELAELRAGVVAEEPEGEVEYRVFDAEGELWASADREEEALHYLAQEPGGRMERAVWVPVKN